MRSMTATGWRVFAADWFTTDLGLRVVRHVVDVRNPLSRRGEDLMLFKRDGLADPVTPATQNCDNYLCNAQRQCPAEVLQRLGSALTRSCCTYQAVG